MNSAEPITPGKGRLWIYFSILIGMAFYIYTVPHKFDDIDIEYSNKIFDRNGIFIGYTFANNFFYESVKDKSIAINNYSEVPVMLIRALSSIEDKSLKNDLENRLGIRLKGMGRAVLFAGQRGGGSGIFQQLVKNLFLLNESDLNRKITESQIASAMYLNYKWEDLVILYLNNVSFGENVRGFKAAAAFFYGKGLKDCSIHELAMLVGMLNGPNRYYAKNDRRKNEQKNLLAVKRRNKVLNEMREDSIITSEEYKDLARQPVKFKFDTDLSKNATTKTLQFNESVKTELTSIFRKENLDSNLTNLNIYTYFDIKAQEAAERVIRTYWRKQFTGQMKKAQVALISIDPSTGGIVTMIGGNPAAPWTGLNRAITLFKPVGSAFKPFFYGTMFENGYALTDTLPDRAITEKWKWIAKNSDGKVSDTCLTLLQCITYSKNVPVCYAMNRHLVSPKQIASLANRCGLHSHLPDNMQIAIGGLTAGVTPLEMANAYAAIKNNGVYIAAHTISRIEKPGKAKNKAVTIFRDKPADNAHEAMSQATASMLRQCLESVVNQGTANTVRLYYKGYAAGKTGTSDDNKDAWFVGFTNNLSTAIWVGFDESNISLPKEYNQGGKIAAPIWGLCMNEIVKNNKRR